MATRRTSHKANSGFLNGLNAFLSNQTWIADLNLLGIRLFLAVVFLQAGYTQFMQFDETVYWFGEELMLPLPRVTAALVVFFQVLGGVGLVFGLLVRFLSLPLIAIMSSAIYLTQWRKGWFYVADFSNPTIADRMEAVMGILQSEGDVEYLFSEGLPAIIQGGMEHSVGYVLMLFVLLIFGSGRLGMDQIIFKQ